MIVTQIIYSKTFAQHDNSSHPENAKRLSTLMDDLVRSPFFHKLSIVEPTLLDEEELYAVHSSEMIQQIKDMSS